MHFNRSPLSTQITANDAITDELLAAPPPFQFTDADGNPLPTLTVNGSATLTKRANTLISCDQAASDTSFPFKTYATQCDRSRGARGWGCWAHDTALTNRRPDYFEAGTCGEHQICVDGVQGENGVGAGIGPNVPFIAYCSDVDNYVKLSTTLLKKLKGRTTISTAIKWWWKTFAYLPGRTDHAIEAIFTGPGGLDDPVTLGNIDIQAISSQLDLARGTRWTTLDERTCQRCSSLGVEPVPRGTSVFGLSPQYPDSMLTGADDAIAGIMYDWKI